MTFIALDDEPLALVLIEKYARDIPEWTLLATFTDAAAAAEYLRNNTVDLLLSDINMPDISGLQFVQALPDERGSRCASVSACRPPPEQPTKYARLAAVP